MFLRTTTPGNTASKNASHLMEGTLYSNNLSTAMNKFYMDTKFLLVASLLFSTNALSSLTLDRMIVYFDPDKPPRQDIIVTNPDKETLYLQTEVFEVRNPGSKNEDRVKITDPEKMHLLTTPNKAIIPSNGRKTVRMVSLKKPTKNELVYRVTFKPVIADIKADKTALKLLVAYQTLVFIRPANPKYNVSAKQEKNQLVFTNSGNINALLRNGQYCTSQKDNSCKPLKESNRLYAGQSWSLELPAETVRVKYGVFDGKFEKTQEFSAKPLPAKAPTKKPAKTPDIAPAA